MEITAMIAMFTIILGVGWRLERKIDKASADHRAEMAALRKENQTTRAELAGRIDKTADRVDKAETRLRGEIQTTRTELTGQIDKTETRLRGEIQTTRTELTGQIDKTETRLREEVQVVGDKVDTLEKRVGHYEQRTSHIEGALNMELGASRQDNPTAA